MSQELTYYFLPFFNFFYFLLALLSHTDSFLLAYLVALQLALTVSVAQTMSVMLAVESTARCQCVSFLGNSTHRIN